MSPASAGALEVERYIGACLITSQNQGRQKPKVQYQQHQRCADVWAGGMPLMYPGRWVQNDDTRNPLARLAVHTQGAPLILTNRYGYRKNRPPKQRNFGCDGGATKKDKDSASVASDEGSNSSVNSENCLPRIIKPRKRRKKDRKPPQHLMHHQDYTDHSSPEIDALPSRFMPYFSFSNIEDLPKLHHSFEDVEDFDLNGNHSDLNQSDLIQRDLNQSVLNQPDFNGNQSESSCQCKYCDPAGQIWDIDTSCYSPFPVSPARSLSYPESTNSSSSIIDSLSSLSLDDIKTSPRSSRDLEVSTQIVTSLNGQRDLEIKFFSMERPVSS